MKSNSNTKHFRELYSGAYWHHYDNVRIPGLINQRVKIHFLDSGSRG